ncbi:MAG: ATP-dependent DNA helicase RecQ [Myxococcaceae bacterium]|nr:ATP-dependent DNA helicase RecQ [Myxococcaceae bacterium]
MTPLEGLARWFSLSSFRPGQADVIDAVLEGHNTVAVMPTGAGKSLCYQLPAMLLDGVTVVVSPLIALMKDQVEQLTAKGLPAAALNSSLSDGQRIDVMRRLADGGLKLLYVAPERLRSEALLEQLQGRVSLFAIDEAHCISAWGHDFRPDYAQLGSIRRRLMPPRTVALTATATPEVRQDIVKVLLMREPRVFVTGFDRPNLYLEVVNVAGDADKRQACLALAREHGSGLVYCPTRKSAESLHAALEKNGVEAVLYHAGLDDDARRRAQDTFMSSQRAVAVATNAFGMGIDKPDIRFVAHAGIPRAVEAYYQEIGRAGRDGQHARAVLLFNHADVFTQERLIQGSHPPQTLIADVWNHLSRAKSYDRGVATLAKNLGASDLEVGAAVKILERSGFLTRSGRGEGAWTFTLADGTAEAQPRSGAARAALIALRELTPDALPTSLDLDAVAKKSGLDLEPLKHAVTLLERAGLLTVKRPFAGRIIHAAKVVPFEELGLDLAQVRTQERRSLLLLRRMTDYAYTYRCRRAFVLRYFGDRPPDQPCNHCDACTGAKLKLVTAAPAQGLGENGTPFSAIAFEALRTWRSQLSASLQMKPYLIFNDATLKNLAAALPTNRDEFLAVRGTGETRWERFGPKVTQVSMMARAAGETPHVTAEVRKRKAG